jgi:DNA-binding GntR family transcriptional regulator
MPIKGYNLVMGNTTKVRSGSVQDAVYSSLRKSILNLNLVPGTGISEKEISLRYKVSRTPVRETFIHLSKEGLVQVIPQKETVVSLIDFPRVEQELFLRESLECAVLEPFIQGCRADHFVSLAQLIKMQSSALESGDYVGFLNYDDEFHRTFFEAAGQDLSWNVLENMGGHYYRVRLLSIRLQSIAQHILGQHKNLMGALKKKDPAGAVLILKQHLHKLNVEEKILREEFPDYFVPSGGSNAFEVDFGGLSSSPAP